MAREALILVLTLSVALAGCAANAASPGGAPIEAMAGPFYASAAPLWHDPQNAPHPGWNWPTLSYPAVGAGVPTLWQPMSAAPPASGALDDLVHVKGRPSGMGSGAGLAVFGKIAVVPGFSSQSYVVDLSTPTAPALLSTFPGAHRGAAIIAYPDGRLVTVLATSSSVEVWNITDPRDPEQLPTLRPIGGSHKVGVVPGTPIVYNANSDGSGAAIEIFDLTNPEAPVLVQNFRGGYGCHHIYFWIDHAQDKERAICAGMQATQILDIADPRAPRVVVTVPVHHGIPGTPSTAITPVRFSHFAILNDDGTKLIVGDETGGGIAPACDAHVEAAGLSKSGPLGDLYFYDVSTETSPQLLGWFNPGAHFVQNRALVGSCTAHHGRLVPDAERDLLVMGFYSAGVVLIDFTDAANPKLVDQFATGTTTWEAWYVNGWVVTGDLSRGMDVLALR